ncbi:hypothetical protein PVK06_036533 [Gossypium arboreum]|uniref:Uncharacterized protein n=1 Tax=Gossypium arboreum TaxID=29729 RepID=A0ABR0NJT4_GOSAR|nr:hypothetical protein PVK06_036533 [Gossypium arboreum]
MRRDQINAKNLEGLTALDIQSQYPWNEMQADRIVDTLSKAGGLSGSASSLPNTSISSFHIESLKEKVSVLQKFATIASRVKKGIPYEMRNTFLIVTVLIITATYTATLSPSKEARQHFYFLKLPTQVSHIFKFKKHCTRTKCFNQ